MRRVLMVLVAVLAVAAAAAAQAAGYRHMTRAIPCPLASPFPCCGPPVDAQPSGSVPCCTVPCCPGPAQPSCPPTLSIAASPDPMTAGTAVTISGTLTHTSAAGTTVQLWQQVEGKTSFSKDGTATTDGSGKWSIKIGAHKVMTNRSWYATASGLQSPTISEPVSAVVALHAGVHRLYGSVSPAHARQRVQLQRRSGTKWLPVAKGRLTRHSRFSFKRAGLHGALRVLLPADKKNALSVSKQLQLP